ncbi:ribonuclease P protein component [Nocardia farcinica]|uniref:ribonuclease P protein component n=1 Tax=Nocardia farcinica TaxID=37329 RepID=UPI000970A987|nr:ribonuclease P protein component [Nocardia farcinica]AXK87117.1 ribonuclease P protein component [Nocardia farcinica]MBA4857924.1 ribonuclease P protein component [Nocardia farcinica]MBC9815554.1 ribonuclease P protein component [Nocardia farcinica]MBF6070039.1 ribonuclease P protein component [Nocardia farcinica]MBF6251191.1 ribonuclease P protein component [Nocardia farcinica]
MLPEPYRLHHRADFSRTVRRGQRIGRRDLVVHAFVHTYDELAHATERHGDPVAAGSFVRVGGPRFGLIVSKAVGSAVVRHRVARRLRHMCATLVDEVPADADVVIRALPGAATADSAELARQLRSGLRKLGVTHGGGRSPAPRAHSGARPRTDARS